MPKTPMIDAIWMARTIQRMEGAGGSVDDALAHAGLSRETVLQPDSRIELRRHVVFIEYLAQQSGDECFGMHNRADADPAEAGVVGFVVMTAPTLGEALKSLVRYQNIHLDARTELAVALGVARVSINVPFLKPNEYRHACEGGLVMILNLFRTLLEDDWSPDEVHFQHAGPSDGSEHRRVFGAPVHFEQRQSALIFDAAELGRDCRTADARLNRVIQQRLDVLLGTGPEQDDLVAALRRLISEALRQGHPAVAPIARAVSMNPRTLQRRLRALDLSFNGVVDDVRQELAQRYLADPGLTLTDIAFLLGYSESSAFTRAHRRWTGVSPQVYRRRLPI